jgi:hypothetical protein
VFCLSQSRDCEWAQSRAPSSCPTWQGCHSVVSVARERGSGWLQRGATGRRRRGRAALSPSSSPFPFLVSFPLPRLPSPSSSPFPFLVSLPLPRLPSPSSSPFPFLVSLPLPRLPSPSSSPFPFLVSFPLPRLLSPSSSPFLLPRVSSAHLGHEQPHDLDGLVGVRRHARRRRHHQRRVPAVPSHPPN